MKLKKIVLSVKRSVKDPNGNIQRRTASKTSPINIPVCSKILAIPNPGLEPVLAAAEINTKGWNICVMIVIVDKIKVSERSIGRSCTRVGVDVGLVRCQAARNGPLTSR